MAKSSSNKSGMLERLGLWLAEWSEKWFPDALVFAFAGIIIVFIFGLLLGESPLNLAIQGGKSFISVSPENPESSWPEQLQTRSNRPRSLKVKNKPARLRRGPLAEVLGTQVPRSPESSGPCSASVGNLPNRFPPFTAPPITMAWLPHP